jgi:hypothetical protein
MITCQARARAGGDDYNHAHYFSISVMHIFVLTRTPNCRQEDAHEYISWLLAAADDEMHAAMSLVIDGQQRAVVAGLHDESAAKAVAALESEADGQWETVGKRSSGGGVVTQVINRSRFELCTGQLRPRLYF